MNAPTAPAAVAAVAKLELIPIEKLTPSKTHIQELRRARFDKKVLQELADSIGKVGILQPIVARPLGLNDSYEIVAGERRYLAGKLAGLKAIPANVAVLSPEQVLEVQLIENLQREGLHELEEAEGYEELMKLKKINAEAVAGMVGKSKSYVYARAKLLALCPEARKAFYAGELDASKALLIARIGHHDTQRQALKDLAGDRWDGPMSYRDAQRHIVERYMLKLKEAPFDINDATLLPKAGDCIKCPKRTGNQTDLFGDVKNADVCTDPKCFGEKKEAHFARQRAGLEKAGRRVISGKDARAVFPHSYSDRAQGGYTLVTEEIWDDPKRRKAIDIVGKDSPAIEYVQHPHNNELVPVVATSAITEALNAKGIKTAAQKRAAQLGRTRKKGAGSKVDDKQDEAVNQEVMLRAFKTLREKAPGVLGRQELLVLARDAWSQASQCAMQDTIASLAAAWGWKVRPSYDTPFPKEAEKLDAKDLARLVLCCYAAQDIENDDAGAAGKLVRLDMKAIRKKVAEDLKKKAVADKAAPVIKAIEKRAAKAKASKKSSKKKAS